jgi:hypothetical protein
VKEVEERRVSGRHEENIALAWTSCQCISLSLYVLDTVEQG